MKLEIDVSSREDVAAALVLLQVIADKFDAVARAVGGGKTAPADTDPAAVFGGAPAAPLAPSIPQSAEASTVAPPAPVIPAPTTMTPGPAVSDAAAGSVELDANGLPWDERIHSSGKTKVKDGTWRYKGGVSPEMIKAVEAELRARAAASAPSVTAQPWPFPVPSDAPNVPPAPGVPNAIPAAPNVSAVETLPPPALPPATATATDPTTFEQLMPRITAAVAAGTMPPAAVSGACNAHGLASVVALQQQPQYVPLVWATLKQQHPALS